VLEDSIPTGSVFLSYASQDAGAAARICEALQAVGVDVWLDTSALRGGDAWDARIKKQIQDCALFVPLISAHTNARAEGYFHREWNLATRRLLDMAHDAAFLVPVVVDKTREADAHVPEEFLRAQWTWLPDGETSPAFAHRVRQLLGGDSASVSNPQSGEAGKPESSFRNAPSHTSRRWFSGYHGKRRMRRVGLGVISLLLVLGAGAFWYYQGESDPAVAKFAPPPHSVAVLAFTNMSGDAKDEYFSDGLSEELLNTLVRIDKLQVAARTSSFSFKGTAVDIPTVGRKLNVAAVLEGSVRKAGERVRITTQLINTVTGYHLWSQTFDRDLKDILALQTEIATEVAGALRIVLLASDKKQLTDGGTSSPKAFDAYLRARKLTKGNLKEENLRAAIALYEEAINLDPRYALAYARLAEALAALANYWSGSQVEQKKELERIANASADKAVELAPNSGQVYGSKSLVLAFTGGEIGAIESALKRGLTLEPGNSDMLGDYARLAVDLGRPDALNAAERAVTLSPLDGGMYAAKGVVLFYLRRYEEAKEAYTQVLRLQGSGIARTWLGTIEIAANRPAAALPHCESQKDIWDGQVCLAIAYYQLGRKPEAAAVLEQMMAENGDTLAFQYAEIYAQWGQKETALKWLETAVQVRDPGLLDIKVDPLIDPIRNEPQFKRIVEQLNFPK
jgi:TolB-like protein/Flp pilus assembly protein TadD